MFGDNFEATIYTSGLTYPAAGVMIEHSNGTRYSYLPVAIGNQTNYNKILVNLIPGVLAGNYKVYVMPDARQGGG